MKRKVWNITVKDNPNRVVMGENDEFYTTDTEAYLVFELGDKNFNPATAVLTLENRNDGSLKNETVGVVDGLIEWEMPERYIEHFGNWQGQLVYEDTKDGQPESYTSAAFTFVVNAHIGDKKRPSLVEIENWEKFIREGTELIETWEDMEDLRQANEAQRQANEQGRKSAESERVANEEERELNEAERISNESERIESEVARKEEMEKARYSRFSNYTYDEIGERLDTIESNTFTSHIFDDSGAPGPKSLIRGNEEAGFYGFVQPHEFGTIEGNTVGRKEMSASNLALSLGITQGIVQNDDTAWMKFHRDGDILFHPVKPLRSRISWNSIYNAGAVYGDGTVGINPPNGRAGNTISVDGSNNAFVIDQIEDHWLRSGANIANAGDTIVARGFSNSENNGEFTVQSITDYQIVVDGNLTTEEGNKGVSVYNKKDAVTQNATVTIGGNVYDVLLLKGADHDPLDSYNDADRDLVGSNSDWNNLVLPLHERAKVGDWNYKSYAGDVEDWGIGLTDETLVTHHTAGEGSYRWMQETGDSHPARRVNRGHYGASGGFVYVPWDTYAYRGWAPALRLVQ